MNAIAGGGTLFTLPALLAVGLPPVAANALGAVAVWPATRPPFPPIATVSAKRPPG